MAKELRLDAESRLPRTEETDFATVFSSLGIVVVHKGYRQPPLQLFEVSALPGKRIATKS